MFIYYMVEMVWDRLAIILLIEIAGFNDRLLELEYKDIAFLSLSVILLTKTVHK